MHEPSRRPSALRSPRPRRRAVAVVALVGVVVALAAACTIDLGTGSGTDSAGTDINAVNTVVGTTTDAAGRRRAFRAPAGGALVELPALTATGDADALAVDDQGVVVGSAGGTDAGGTFLQQAVRWGTDGQITVIGGGTLGGSYAAATDLNASGTVVGYSGTTGDAAQVAWFWAPGSPTLTALPGLGGATAAANGINASGQIVGVATTPDEVTHAVSWAAGTHTITVLSPSSAAEATDVDDTGAVAGSVYSAQGVGHAVRWAAGTFGRTDLPGLGGESSAGNGISAGTVVGWAEQADGTTMAVRWAPGAAAPVALGRLTGQASTAEAVNPTGHVAGTASTAGELGQHAVRFDP